MSLTLKEICGIMRTRYDPEEIVELLNISSEELVDKFDYKIEEDWDFWQEELADEETDDDEM